MKHLSLCLVLVMSFIAVTTLSAKTRRCVDPELSYLIENAGGRGALYASPSRSALWVWSTGKNDDAGAEAYRRWAFVPAGGTDTYYIYNLGRQRFIAPMEGGSFADGPSWAFTPERVAVKVTPLEDGTVALRTAQSEVWMSVSNMYAGPVISYYAEGDAGLPFHLVPQERLTKEERKLLKQSPVGLMDGEVTATQGFQTTGQGNRNAVILRLDMLGFQGVNTLAQRFSVTLKPGTRDLISGLRLYATAGNPEFYAVNDPQQLCEMPVPQTDEATFTLPQPVLLQPGVNHFWLTADIRDDAPLGSIIDAALTSVAYVENGKTKSLDITAYGDPEAQGMKVFATQSQAFVPTTAGCRFYRIPAMILDRDGNIVAAADRRYDSDFDLGNHKIDVSVRHSYDGGRTWTQQLIIAKGDGSTDADFGYGDPALARTQDGRLICVMAAGRQNFFYGMRHAAVTVSDDNGYTWTAPRQLFQSAFRDEVHGLDNAIGFHSYFTTSGKGLTTRDGTVMFAANCVEQPRGPLDLYVLASKDGGDTWTLGPDKAYAGCDESKLEELNDGRILVSVRQHGNRGFNIADSTASKWGTPWRSEVVSGNACNADILYYSRATEGNPDILLHTYIKDASRQNLWLAVSTDEGRTWRDVMNIQPGPCAYSTMLKLPDGSVGIMFEDESYSAGNGYALTYIRLTAEQILSLAR